MAESQRISTVESGYHTAEYFWKDDNTGFMRISPPIEFNDRIHEIIREKGELKRFEQAVLSLHGGYHHGAALLAESLTGPLMGGGSIFFIEADTEKREIPQDKDEATADLEARAQNAARTALFWAGAASSSREFTRLAPLPQD